MARSRRKKALYEVMSKSRLNSNTSPKLEPLRPQEKVKKEIKTTVPSDTPHSEISVKWWKRPQWLQFNAGRIEISLPYQIAVVIVLLIILFILAAFRLGQLEQKIANPAETTEKSVQAGSLEHPASDAGLNPELMASLRPREVKPAPTGQQEQGDHVIVLVQYPTMADLVPVRQHFAENGINTEIVQEGNWYYLVTKNKYQNPNNPGTDGYETLQKIIEIGAKYKGKAPEGRETFSPHFFRDAYGKKVR
jgi:hypothetical protein